MDSRLGEHPRSAVVDLAVLLSGAPPLAHLQLAPIHSPRKLPKTSQMIVVAPVLHLMQDQYNLLERLHRLPKPVVQCRCLELRALLKVCCTTKVTAP